MWIPDCFEDEAGKICCRACHTASGADTRTWIGRASWKKHSESPAHSNALQQAAQSRQQVAATRQQYDSIYSNMPVASLQAPVLSDSRPRAQFRPILSDEDTNGVAIADFEDTMMQEADALRATPEQDDFVIKNAELLRRERELLQLEALDEEFEGADDETIPHFVQDIQENGRSILLVESWSLTLPKPTDMDPSHLDGEDEDEINRYFTGVPVSDDYAPYGNKTVGQLNGYSI